jgi:hypothetical protein
MSDCIPIDGGKSLTQNPFANLSSEDLPAAPETTGQRPVPPKTFSTPTSPVLFLHL